MKEPQREVEGRIDREIEILLLKQSEVRRAIDIDALLIALEHGFVALSSGRAAVPARIAAIEPDGSLLAAMPGFVNQTLAAKLVSIFPGNHARGLPSHQAVIVLFDPDTGAPLALMDGTYITAIRTGGATAVATKLLARRDARILAVLGAGTQGQAHLATVPRTRQFREIRVASRNSQHAQEVARLHPGVKAVGSMEEAVRGADVICACTDAAMPVIQHEWLKPGVHINSVGFGTGPELSSQTMRSGRVFVESRNAFKPYPAGAHELQELDSAEASELGEVLTNQRRGRQSDLEITIYKSTGHAVEDAAAAQLVFQTARDHGIGTKVLI